MPGRGYFFSFIAIFSIFMGGSFAASTLLITSNLISTKQIQQKSLIEQLAISNLSDDAKLLSKQLRTSIQFEFLTIKDTDNNVLYRYIKDKKQLPVITKVLKHFDLFTSVQRVKTSPGKLVIEFQPSYEQLLIPMTVITVIAFAAPIMLCLLIYLLTGAVMDKRMEKVTKHLELLAKSTDSEVTSKLSPKHIKPFENVISSIELLKENPATNDDPNLDSLTNLPSGLKFVTEFPTLIQAVDNDNYNAFVLVRATSLQKINLNQGYKSGDQHILDINKHLKSYVESKRAQLYKLNGVDFGALLSLPKGSDAVNRTQSLSDEISQLLERQLSSNGQDKNIKVVVIELAPNTQLEQLLSEADAQAS